MTDPAFPVNELHQSHGGVCAQYFGISARDYFAAKALQGLLTNPHRISSDGATKTLVMQLTREAFAFADEMLAIRNEPKQSSFYDPL